MKAQKEHNKAQKPAVLQKKPVPETGGTANIEDKRASTVHQRKLRETMNTSAAGKAGPVQRKANNTGLPDNLKTGIENLSGYAMDDVKVHYNSSKPAQLQAHAYAQGTDIHLGPGQEKHLPHEAWHVVQQKQGRVKPTKQLKSKVNINDDAGLEKEADVMGAKALQKQTGKTDKSPEGLAKPKVAGQIAQRNVIGGRQDTEELIDDEKEDENDPFFFSGLSKSTYNMIVRDQPHAIICRVSGDPGYTYNEAKEKLENTDVERSNDFKRFGAESINKNAYRLKNWVALVSPDVQSRFQGIPSRRELLQIELEELSKFDDANLDIPSLGNSEIINCLKNGVPALGFLEEYIRGEELKKTLNRNDYTTFTDYIFDDINQSVFPDAKRKFKNAQNSAKKLYNYIVKGNNVIHDFQLVYKRSTGKILVIDPGNPGASDPRRNSKVIDFLNWLHRDFKDASVMNRKWNRVNNTRKKRRNDWK